MLIIGTLSAGVRCCGDWDYLVSRVVGVRLSNIPCSLIDDCLLTELVFQIYANKDANRSKRRHFSKKPHLITQAKY